MSPTLDAARLEKNLARLKSPLAIYAFQGMKMPLGLAAGLRVDAIDARSCVVSLPGGWRTQNPFGSMYWAAQGMAAEMATGVHGYAMCQAAPVPIRMILAGCEARFTHMCKGRGTFTFSQGDRVVTALEETMRTGESVNLTCDVVGHDAQGVEVSAWTFTWSFRARTARPA